MDPSNYDFTHARGVALGGSVLELIQKRLATSFKPVEMHEALREFRAIEYLGFINSL